MELRVMGRSSVPKRLGTPTTRDLVILAKIDEPRVDGILREAGRSGDRLVRHHAAEALERRNR